MEEGSPENTEEIKNDEELQSPQSNEGEIPAQDEEEPAEGHDDVPEMTVSAEEEEIPLNITKESEDCEVNWPEGAVFEVEVDHPEIVDEYYWSFYDGLNIDIDARGTGIEADHLTIDDDVTLNIHSKANTVCRSRQKDVFSSWTFCRD